MAIDYSMKKFFEEIVRCLVEYGNLEYDEAVEQLHHAGVYDEMEDKDTVEVNPVVGHEMPYYWAMVILYQEDDPLWYKNPKLWPEPEKEVRRWYGDDFIDDVDAWIARGLNDSHKT